MRSPLRRHSQRVPLARRRDHEARAAEDVARRARRRPLHLTAFASTEAPPYPQRSVGRDDDGARGAGGDGDGNNVGDGKGDDGRQGVVTAALRLAA